MEVSDWELVQRARGGDAQAFGALVDRHAPALFRAAAALLSNASDAQDVVQEVLLAVYRQLGRFEGRSSVRTWLMGITVRQAALHRRKAARDRTIPFAGNETEPTAGSARKTEDFAARADARMDLAQALDALAEEHRQVIVMRELQGMTYDEMAAALNLPRGTIESRLFRARQALRRLLGEE